MKFRDLSAKQCSLKKRRALGGRPHPWALGPVDAAGRLGLADLARLTAKAKQRRAGAGDVALVHAGAGPSQ